MSHFSELVILAIKLLESLFRSLFSAIKYRNNRIQLYHSVVIFQTYFKDTRPDWDTWNTFCKRFHEGMNGTRMTVFLYYMAATA